MNSAKPRPGGQPQTFEGAFDDAFATSEGGREHNEDCVGARTVDGVRCWVIADGVGGRGGGRIASHLAVDTVLESFAHNSAVTQSAVKCHIDRAHIEIVTRQKIDIAFAEMQTTLVVLVSDGQRAVWGHVGDSRLYHFRNGRVLSQTQDHSFSQVKVTQGQIAPDNVRHDPDRNVLLQSVGKDGFRGPTVSPKTGDAPVELRRGDSFLLCVDGFWGLVHETEMEIDWAKSDNASDWLRFMRLRADRALTVGSDNYTAYAVLVTTPGLAAPEPMFEAPPPPPEPEVVREPESRAEPEAPLESAVRVEPRVAAEPEASPEPQISPETRLPIDSNPAIPALPEVRSEPAASADDELNQRPVQNEIVDAPTACGDIQRPVSTDQDAEPTRRMGGLRRDLSRPTELVHERKTIVILIAVVFVLVAVVLWVSRSKVKTRPHEVCSVDNHRVVLRADESAAPNGRPRQIEGDLRFSNGIDGLSIRFESLDGKKRYPLEPLSHFTVTVEPDSLYLLKSGERPRSFSLTDSFSKVEQDCLKRSVKP